MIPKVIHYCWFGGAQKSAKMKSCIASWKKYCPDYEIIEWNEQNYDVMKNAYLAYCHNEKKWAFLSDYARLDIVLEHGGIYMDTDVELLRSPDPLLKHHAYFGFETSDTVNTGLGFGAEKGNAVVRSMLSQYDPLLDGAHGTAMCPALNTEGLLPFGLRRDGTLQDLGDAVVYPPSAFNPYDDPTGRLRVTDDTYSIHWFSKSWMDKKTVLRSKLTKPLHRIFGTDAFHRGRS